MDDVAVLLGGIDLSKYASAPGTSAEAEETEDSADHQDRFSSSGLPGREGGEAVACHPHADGRRGEGDGWGGTGGRARACLLISKRLDV